MSVQEEWTIVQKSKKKERKKQFRTAISTSTSSASASSFAIASSSSILSSGCLSSTGSSFSRKKDQDQSVQKFLKMVEQTIYNSSKLEYFLTLKKLTSFLETHFGNVEGRIKKVATAKDEQENILICKCKTIRHRLSACVLSLVAKKGQRSKSLLCSTFNNQIESEEVYKQGPLMDLDPGRKSEPPSVIAKDEEKEKDKTFPALPETSSFSMKFISFSYLSKFPTLPKVVFEMLSCPFVVKIWASDTVPWDLVQNLFEGSPTSTNIFISGSGLLNCFSCKSEKDERESILSFPVAEIVSHFLGKSIKAREKVEDAAFEHSVLLHYLAVSLRATSNTWPPVSTRSIENFQILKLRSAVSALFNNETLGRNET